MPKHHFALHLSRALKRHGVLVSLFTCERRHKILKRWLHDRRTLQSFERGAMEEITLDHLHTLHSVSLDKAGIGSEHAPSRRQAEALRAFAIDWGLPLAGHTEWDLKAGLRFPFWCVCGTCKTLLGLRPDIVRDPVRGRGGGRGTPLGQGGPSRALSQGPPSYLFRRPSALRSPRYH